jgi:hypothetical protein
MAEPIDVIVPILQGIQSDLAALARKVDRQSEILDQHSEKLDAIDGYLTYQLGVGTRAIADVENLKSDIREIKRRVELLERR